MLSRKEQTEAPTFLPEDWKQEVTALLDDIYKKDLEKLNKTFIVHGTTYPNELCIGGSLLDRNDGLTAPIAYLMSADLDKDSDVKKLISALVDSVGAFFDEFFSTEDWSDYQTRWEDTTFSKFTFFYKVSRENIALSIIGDELLKNSLH